MSRDDKRIKKWRSAGTLGELYLKEMAEDEKLSVSAAKEPKTIIIDYGGPNVAKPLHVGHLRSACADGRGTGGICEGWLAGGLPL